MRELLSSLLVAGLLCNCVFDRAGLLPSDTGLVLADGGQPNADLPSDVVAPQDEGSLADSAVAHDAAVGPDGVSRRDGATRDAAHPPDTGPAARPITVTGLRAAFAAARVPCTAGAGQLIPIVDNSIEAFKQIVPSSLALDTRNWVGAGNTAVSILWDPNACGDESHPIAPEWYTAGLLIRRATLDGQGRLLLAPGTRAADINLINATSDGSFQEEIFQPDDSGLSSYSQWVLTVNRAKQLVLQLAGLL